MITYKRNYNKTKFMYFLIKKEKGFDKYNEICEKVSNIIKNECNVELVYYKNYLKAEKVQHKRRLLEYFVRK